MADDGSRLFYGDEPTLPDRYQGTTYQSNFYTGRELGVRAPEDKWASFDPRNMMYGRSPGGADAAVQQAQLTGQGANATGQNIYGENVNNSRAVQDRQAFMGDFGAQNNALGISGGYGQSLATLENQQGPSAAQAQLQQGTNQALGSQIAMARSGRGFGGGAGSAGLAQSNMAGLQANQANQAASLRAQEDAAWRGRQAANLGAAAGIQQGIGSQYGQQVGQQLQSYYQNQGQNDAAALGWAGQGADAYFQGVGADLAGQGLGNEIRGAELDAGMYDEDRRLRAWAAQNGYNLGEAQRQDQKDAAERGMWASGVSTVADWIS